MSVSRFIQCFQRPTSGQELQLTDNSLQHQTREQSPIHGRKGVGGVKRDVSPKCTKTESTYGRECVSQVSCEKKIKLKIQYYHYYDFNQARMRGNLTLWCAERQNKPTHPLFNLWHMMCIMSVGSRRISHCMHQCRVVPCHAKKA